MREYNGCKQKLHNVTLKSDSELNEALKNAVIRVMERQACSENKLMEIEIRALQTTATVDRLSEEVSSLKHIKPVKQIVVVKESPKFSDDNSFGNATDKVDNILYKIVNLTRIRKRRTHSTDVIVDTVLETKLGSTSSPIHTDEYYLQKVNGGDEESFRGHQNTSKKEEVCTREGEKEAKKNLDVFNDFHSELSAKLQKENSAVPQSNVSQEVGPLNLKIPSDDFSKKENIAEITSDIKSKIVEPSISDFTISSFVKTESDITRPKYEKTDKVASIFESESSENETENEPMQLNVDTEDPPVVFRDVKQLSPRALSRDISPIIDVDVIDEVSNVIKNEERVNPNSTEKSFVTNSDVKKPEKDIKNHKKSIFDSDSDEDLFKPINIKKSYAHEATKINPVNVTSSSNSAKLSPKISKDSALHSHNTDVDNFVPKKKVTSIFDDSSDSEDSLFRPITKSGFIETVKNQEPQLQTSFQNSANKTSMTSSRVASGVGTETSVKERSLFSDDSDSDELFKSGGTKKEQNSEEEKEMNNRTPGKLNVSAFGGKLNNLLLNGPPGATKSPKVNASPSSSSADSTKHLPRTSEENKYTATEDLFRSPSNTVTNKRSPGKLDVNLLGGKLNKLLLSGPPDIKRESNPPENKDADDSATLNIGILKARPRGPANRRPPTRSMVISSSSLPMSNADSVKRAQSVEEDPLSK